MVIWSDWLDYAGTAMDMTSTQAGVVLSLIMTASIIFCVLIASRGRGADYSVPSVALLLIILFTFIGWFPLYIGSILALIFSVFLANKIAGGLRG